MSWMNSWRILAFCLSAFFLTSSGRAQTPPAQRETIQQWEEQFLLMVTPIEQWCGPSKLGTATGFFFLNDNHLYLVTNRHVVREDNSTIFPDKLRIRLHTNAADHTQNSSYDLPLYKNGISTWREKPGVDLVAIELSQTEMSRFVIKAFAPSFFAPADIVIATGDDVVVIGYPRGFSDVLHNYPVTRTGAIASAYPIPFNGQPYFLVDARLHPGTSGSPVLTKPSSTLLTQTGLLHPGGVTTYFLGVNSGEVIFPGESSGLNGVWYASEVQIITTSSFRTATFADPNQPNKPQ
jgi:Trypsin-like peptidase domain